MPCLVTLCGNGAQLADDGQSNGLTIITKDKYGVTVRDGTAGLTLLRSAFVTEADHHPKIREGVRPDYSDIGRQTIEIALACFDARAPMEEQPAALADTLFTPCQTYRGAALDCGLVAVENAPSLTPSWAEPEAGGWMLRLHETLGRDGLARIRIAEGWTAEPVGLDSLSVGSPVTGVLELAFAQYKVLSVRFRRE